MTAEAHSLAKTVRPTNTPPLDLAERKRPTHALSTSHTILSGGAGRGAPPFIGPRAPARA